jgi:hypothetical protein
LGGKIPLKIVGDGPLAAKVTEAAQQIPGVEWLGRKPLKEVYELMGEAAFLVFPSEWYETFGLVAIEALAKGTPVIAANIGAIAELALLINFKHLLFFSRLLIVICTIGRLGMPLYIWGRINSPQTSPDSTRSWFNFSV